MGLGAGPVLSNQAAWAFQASGLRPVAGGQPCAARGGWAALWSPNPSLHTGARAHPSPRPQRYPQNARPPTLPTPSPPTQLAPAGPAAPASALTWRIPPARRTRRSSPRRKGSLQPPTGQRDPTTGRCRHRPRAHRTQTPALRRRVGEREVGDHERPGWTSRQVWVCNDPSGRSSSSARPVSCAWRPPARLEAGGGRAPAGGSAGGFLPHTGPSPGEISGS